jgi:hypothetical protein
MSRMLAKTTTPDITVVYNILYLVHPAYICPIEYLLKYGFLSPQ